MDFLIANDRDPFLLVECKLTDEQPGKALLTMQKALQVPAVQLVSHSVGYRTYGNGDLPILVAPACQWCAGLP